tara:strand:+ start:674 stop:883 length:210 start_codon:yes stop_codon:yes gene_type:complete
MAMAQVQRGVQSNVGFQPVQKPRVLEQNAEIHRIEPEKKEKNFPVWMIIGLLVLVLLVGGLFLYFRLTR